MKILVPVKSIPSGIPAAFTGINLAKQLGGKVIFLHVAEDRILVRSSFLTLSDSMIKTLKEIGREILGQVTEKADEAGIKSESLMLEGLPHEEILSQGEECELIVMSARIFPRGGRGDDTTQHVIENTKKPVLLTGSILDRFDRFFVGFDGSKQSYRAIEYLKKGSLKPKEIFIGYVASTPEKRKAGPKLLEEAKESMAGLNLPVSTSLMSVDEKEKIAEEILHFCKDNEIDLCFVGKTGKGAFKRFFLGSVSRRL
ncbi:universal stress protein, partial [archaeon]|nr:universal stress protein [archaeon]